MNQLPEKAALAALARTAAGGDRDAFRSWLERTHRVVFGVAFRLVGNRADAEDAVQATYVRAWQGIGQLRDMDASLGWVCGIARHVALDQRRAKARRPTHSLDEMTADGAPRAPQPVSTLATPDELALTNARKAAVHQALQSLEPHHRDVLMLREMEGLPYEDVAVALDVPVGTVESRVHRARLALARKLRTMLGKDGGG